MSEELVLAPVNSIFLPFTVQLHLKYKKLMIEEKSFDVPIIGEQGWRASFTCLLLPHLILELG